MFSKIIDSDTLERLYENDEFCTKLGKVILSSSKLAEQLLILIKNDKIESDIQKPPMMMLIKYIEKKEFFPNIVPVLYQMNEGNIDQLLHKMIKKSFLDEETEDFINGLIDLEEKLNLICNIMKEHNKIVL